MISWCRLADGLAVLQYHKKKWKKMPYSTRHSCLAGKSSTSVETTGFFDAHVNRAGRRLLFKPPVWTITVLELCLPVVVSRSLPSYKGVGVLENERCSSSAVHSALRGYPVAIIALRRTFVFRHLGNVMSSNSAPALRHDLICYSLPRANGMSFFTCDVEITRREGPEGPSVLKIRSRRG